MGEDQNDEWLKNDADKTSEKSNYSAMANGVVFDDKYEFVDHTILGEVSQRFEIIAVILLVRPNYLLDQYYN